MYFGTYVFFINAAFSLPRPGLKAEVFDRLLTDTALSNDHVDALIAGFAVDAQLIFVVVGVIAWLGFRQTRKLEEIM